MPPKKKTTISLDEFSSSSKGGNKGDKGGAKKGFYNGNDDSASSNHHKGGYNKDKDHHNEGGFKKSYNNNSNSNSHAYSHDTRKFGNKQNFSDSDTSTHTPYWPISLVNAYTLPFSMPLPVHFSKDDIRSQFTTNGQQRQSKAQQKKKGPPYNNSQVDLPPQEDDNEFTIDTLMRKLYNHGLHALVNTEKGTIELNPLNDDPMLMPASSTKKKSKNTKNKGDTNEDDFDSSSAGQKYSTAHTTDESSDHTLDVNKKIQLPAFSDLVPFPPSTMIKQLSQHTLSKSVGGDISKLEAMMSGEEVDAMQVQPEVVDSGPFSSIGKPKKSALGHDLDDDMSWLDPSLSSDLVPIDSTSDFNITKLATDKYNRQFSQEYPCLVEGPLVVAQRDRNNYLRLQDVDYDIMIHGTQLNRAFHSDHVVANVQYPNQWRVQRVIPKPVVEGADANANQAKNDQKGPKGQQHNGQGSGDKKQRGPPGSEVGQWCAVRQVHEINDFLETNAVQRILQIEYLRQVDYWFKACRYGVYSTPVNTDEEANLAAQRDIINTDGIMSPTGIFSPLHRTDNTADNEDEFNTTLGIDKTSTLYGYGSYDVTSISLHGYETKLAEQYQAIEAEKSNANQDDVKLTQLLEQYLVTKNMWKKYKQFRINSLYSQHPILLPNVASTTTTATQAFNEFDATNPTAIRDAVFSWYSNLQYRSAAQQALSSDAGLISPLTPPSLTGPLPILHWNPSMWYVNFMMALLHAFFPHFQFQPTASIVSIRNAYGPGIKFQLPPISKVFGYWLHDNSAANSKSLVSHSSSSGPSSSSIHNYITTTPHKPTSTEQGYVYDHYLEKVQYPSTAYRHISQLPLKHVEPVEDVPQKGKKGGKQAAKPTAALVVEDKGRHKNQIVTWYRGYNAQLAQSSYAFPEDMSTMNPQTNQAVTFDQNVPKKAEAEEELGKTNNNKKSLYPCLPDHIKNALHGRERYFCSTFVGMEITTVFRDVWMTAINFPIEALTSHTYNSGFKFMVSQYTAAVQQVLQTINAGVGVMGFDNLIDNTTTTVTTTSSAAPLDRSANLRRKIEVQLQPQNLRFPSVTLTLSYFLISDIEDHIVKQYCESNGIIYDVTSASNSNAFLEGNSSSNTNDTGLKSDELREALGDQYTYPCQILLEIEGVDMNLLRTHAPKLYSWFLCTLSRLHSMATFIQKKFDILNPLIKAKETELHFTSALGGKKKVAAPALGEKTKKDDKNPYDEQFPEDLAAAEAAKPIEATPQEEKLNQMMADMIQKTVPAANQMLLFVQPHHMHLVNDTSNIPTDQNAQLGTGGGDKDFGFGKKHQGKGMARFQGAQKVDDDKKATSQEFAQRLIEQRLQALSQLDSICVGPEDAFERVVNPTYSLSIVESQSLSKFIPGIFIIEYTSWFCAEKSPTVVFHNELGGKALINSSDKLLPVLIKHKITQSDVFPISVEAELQAQLDSLSGPGGKAEVKDEWPIPQSEADSRADLRNLLIFSIDPLTAKDLDDTLSIDYIGLSTQWPADYFSQIKASSGPKAIFRVGVHIADVSYFVQTNSLLDQEASSRSTSVYLSTFVIPMLPRILCEELCSLNMSKDRLAFSCFFLMDEDGTVLEIERHVRAKHTARFDDKIVDVVTRTKDGKSLTEKQKLDRSDRVIQMQERGGYDNKIYTLSDLVEHVEPKKGTQTGDKKKVGFGSLQQLEGQLTVDGEDVKYHNDISDFDDEDDDYDSDSDQDNTNKHHPANLSAKQEANLLQAVQDLSIDPLSQLSKRKRGKAPERRRKQQANSDDDGNNSDPEDNMVSLKGSSKTDPSMKDKVTPHEAWNRFVTETSWYGKSIIRSALKLDYYTAMLLVKCAFEDPLYDEMISHRNEFIEAKINLQNDPHHPEYTLLSSRNSSIPLQVAELEALSPLDVSMKLGLHSDEAIIRQVQANSELNLLFFGENGRCRPGHYCAQFYDPKVYGLSSQEARQTGNGQNLIPDIARACRLLHSLGMKRRQERLTALGSLTLTRNKLSFKFGYELDHWLSGQSENGIFDPILLPVEDSRAVQHYTMYPLHDTNRMIEEYMLLANEFVAKRIYRLLPKHALLRKHPNPDENKLLVTTAFLQKLGIPLKTDSAGILQQSLVSLQEQYQKIVLRIDAGEFNQANMNTENNFMSFPDDTPSTEEEATTESGQNVGKQISQQFSPFEEVCYRLHQAGCDVRSIAEEFFAQTMIAAQYFPTGMSALPKDKISDISAEFGISVDTNKKTGKKPSVGKGGPLKTKGGKKETEFGAKQVKTDDQANNRQFKWALECAWVKEFKHYALNMEFYTHFTSPIRRYPDIIVHRVLEASLMIEPASNTLPTSPYYKINVDTTIDNLLYGKNPYPEHKKTDAVDVPAPNTGIIEHADLDVLSTASTKALEKDDSVFKLVRIIPTQQSHVKVKGVSASLSNAQLYVRTTTPQLMAQQCTKFNEQKSFAKYAGDDSSNLTFSELILKRKYQLEWLLTHDENNNYQHPNDMLALLLDSTTQNFTPLNSIPDTPDSIGISYVQQLFPIEQPLLPKGYNINDPRFEKTNSKIKEYLSGLKLTIRNEIDLNINAFLTLLTQKAIVEGKSISTNPEVTKQYIINFFLKAPILVEKGVIFGATNRSNTGEVAIYLPSTQQTIQLMTDTQQQKSIVPKLVQGIPVGGVNVGCTIIQGDYLLTDKSKAGSLTEQDQKDDYFLSLLKKSVDKETETDKHLEEDYGKYDREFLEIEASERALLAKGGLDAGGNHLVRGGPKDKNAKKGANEDPRVKSTGANANTAKKTNRFAAAITDLSISSVWLITWDPLFAPLAWFDWSMPVARKKIDQVLDKEFISGNTLTLADCTHALPRYVENGVWSTFVSQHKNDFVFIPTELRDKEEKSSAGVASYFTADTGMKTHENTNSLTTASDDDEGEAKPMELSVITEFAPHTEAVRLFDTVRVVLLPMIPELTFKPILIPNLVKRK